MAFTYNNSLSADRDKIRFLIQDVDSSSVIFQDSELDGVLNIEGNLFRAVAIALRAIAMQPGKLAVAFSIGTRGEGLFSVDRRQLIPTLLKLADHWEERAISTPDEAWDRLDFGVDDFGRDISHYQGAIDD